MAKRKLEQPIKWNKEKSQELTKAIKEFNQRVRKLEKSRKDPSYLPQEIYIRETKKLITTERELNEVISSLKGFKGKEAYKKVTLKSGESLTAWEYGELKKQQKIAKARIKKELAKVDRPYGKMGTAHYQRLESIQSSIKGFEKLTGSAFQIAKERLSNWGSTDYDMRRAIIYKQNYLSMLNEEFKNEKNYKKLVMAIKNIHPINFYESVKLLEMGDKVKDISYMYDFGGRAEFDDLVELFVEEDEEGE